MFDRTEVTRTLFGALVAALFATTCLATATGPAMATPLVAAIR